MRDDVKAMGSFGTVGLEIVLSILFGGYAGHWLDGRFATGPWLTVVGVAYGVAAAARAIVRVAREMKAVTTREEREEGNPSPKFDPPAELEPTEGTDPARTAADATGDGGERKPER